MCPHALSLQAQSQIIQFAPVKKCFLFMIFLLTETAYSPYSMEIDNDEATHYRDSFIEVMNDVEN